MLEINRDTQRPQNISKLRPCWTYTPAAHPVNLITYPATWLAIPSRPVIIPISLSYLLVKSLSLSSSRSSSLPLRKSHFPLSMAQS